MTLSSSHAAIFDALLDSGCLHFGGHTLTSGISLPAYLELRSLCSHPALLRQIAGLLGQTLPCFGSEPCTLVGIPLGGYQLATAASLNLGNPAILLRQEVKSHGLLRQWEGSVNTPSRCVLFDDFFTTGRSAASAATKLTSVGFQPVGLSVVFDSRLSGVACQGGDTLPTRPLFSLGAFLSYVRQHPCMSAQQRADIDAVLAVLEPPLHGNHHACE